MNEIFSAQIYLDDDMPEYMEGLIRVGSVEFFNEAGEIVYDVDLNNKLVDNTEFHEPDQLIKYVAKIIGIDPSQIEIVG